MENKELREIPDLLYPDAARRRELNNRRIMLNDKYPCTYMSTRIFPLPPPTAFPLWEAVSRRWTAT